METVGRKPDYKVSALNKDTEEKGPVGVAWINEDKSISIKLNSFVKLEGNLLITLWVNDDVYKKKQKPKESNTEVTIDAVPF